MHEDLFVVFISLLFVLSFFKNSNFPTFLQVFVSCRIRIWIRVSKFIEPEPNHFYPDPQYWYAMLTFLSLLGWVLCVMFNYFSLFCQLVSSI